MSDYVVTITDLEKTYVTEIEKLKILNKLNLTVQAGSKTVITGESGCGKSTLLNIIGGLDFATGGIVVCGKYEITALKEKELAEYRSGFLGFIFQFHYLLKDFTALENVFMPAYMAGAKKKDAVNRAEQLLADVGLEKRLNHLLDPANSANVGDMLFSLADRYKKTLILVTHDKNLASCGDCSYELKNGVLVKV